jgi:hypothetical protein
MTDQELWARLMAVLAACDVEAEVWRGCWEDHLWTKVVNPALIQAVHASGYAMEALNRNPLKSAMWFRRWFERPLDREPFPFGFFRRLCTKGSARRGSCSDAIARWSVGPGLLNFEQELALMRASDSHSEAAPVLDPIIDLTASVQPRGVHEDEIRAADGWRHLRAKLTIYLAATCSPDERRVLQLWAEDASAYCERAIDEGVAGTREDIDRIRRAVVQRTRTHLGIRNQDHAHETLRARPDSLIQLADLLDQYIITALRKYRVTRETIAAAMVILLAEGDSKSADAADEAAATILRNLELVRGASFAELILDPSTTN